MAVAKPAVCHNNVEETDFAVDSNSSALPSTEMLLPSHYLADASAVQN